MTLAPEAFAGALGQRLAGAVAGALAVSLAGLDHAGLYLAHACVLGDSKALARFDAHCVAELDAALPAAGVSAAQVAEAKQRVRQKLLVAGPRVRRGWRATRGAATCGALCGSWRCARGLGVVRQTARREAHEVSAADEQLERATVGEDPELLMIKETHRAALREAFAAALGSSRAASARCCAWRWSMG